MNPSRAFNYEIISVRLLIGQSVPHLLPYLQHKLVKLCVCKRLTRNILKRGNYVKGAHILSIYIYIGKGVGVVVVQMHILHTELRK